MPQFNIHWKGRPHHRLPRIRVASTPRNSIRTRSQTAAKQVLQIPLGSALEQARKKERFNFRLRRRRARSSRSTSAVVRSRRQVSQRARQHIQVFGWDTSQAEVASQATFENLTLGASSIKARAGTRSSAALRIPQSQRSVVHSTDGAASCSIRNIKRNKEPENLYSLMHVAELPVYTKSSKTAGREKPSLNSDRLSIHSARWPGLEYAHVGPLETVSRRDTSRGSQALERRRTYDCRIDPKKRVEELRSKSGPAQINTTSQVPPEKKQQSRESAAIREPVSSLALQTKAEGSDTLSNHTVVPSVFSENASRTPSQRKALKKFTREIELYLQACRSLPKGSLIATPSLSTISAYTVDELKPYQAQFQSAGLAVTSNEQRGLVKLQEESSPPPTPPKDLKWSKIDSSSKDKMGFRNKKQNDKSQKRREPSYASGSTGTTVMVFTPPHEKSYPQPKTARKPSSESDHTIISFTPPHKRVPPPPSQQPPSAPKTPAKKSLPWLRRADASPEPISPTKKMSALSKADEDKPSTPLEGWITSSEPSPEMEKGPETLRTSGLPDTPEPSIPQYSGNVQWNEMAYDREQTFVKQQSTISTRHVQVSTQLDDVDAGATETSLYATTYADTSTQTNADGVASPPNARQTTIKNEDVKMTRAPFISGRNRTFPLIKNNFKGDCNIASELIPASSSLQSRKPSRVKWEGVDREIQTDNMKSIEPQLDENQSRQDRNRNRMLNSELKGERSPIKSVDGRKFPTKTKSKGSVEYNALSTESNIQHPPQAPSTELCIKCANEFKLAASEPDPQPESPPELEPDPEPTPRVGLDQTRNARPALVCQQCFPSRQESTAISPLQTSPREMKYALSRRSTRPIPAGTVAYSEERTRPSTVGQCIDDVVKGGAAPTERNQPIQLIKGTAVQYASEMPIADPMKKPSLPRQKLKLPPPLEQKQYCTTSRPRPVPPASQPTTVINLPIQLPDLASISSVDTGPSKPGTITDKQVFKGLHVATAAACDEDVEKWIEEITGCGVRKFLADLSRFEGLGVNTLADVAKRAARQRRERLMAWEAVREARVTKRDTEKEEFSRGIGESCGAREEVDWLIGEMGVAREEYLACGMVHSGDCKESESIK